MAIKNSSESGIEVSCEAPTTAVFLLVVMMVFMMIAPQQGHAATPEARSGDPVFSSGGPVLSGGDNVSAARARATDGKLIRLAQATSSLKVARIIKGKPGGRIKSPITVVSKNPLSPTTHVIIDGTPKWISLSKGEAVGEGVWLLQAKELKDLELIVAPNASGSSNMSALLVDGNGKVLSETEFSINLSGGSKIARGPTTWQSLVPGAGTPAATAKKAPKKPKVTRGKAKKKKAAWRKPKQSAKKKMNRKQQTAYAKYLVRECTTCHSLFGSDDGIPLMIGLKVDRFIDTIELYQSGKRDNQAMVDVSRSLDDQQVLALATYLGRITPPRRSATAARRRGVVNTTSASVSDTGKAAAQRGGKRTARARRKVTEAKLKRARRWVTRGEALIQSGRIAQARLWFKRAAEYGVAQAAILLGASFDPNYLARSPGGLDADSIQARGWYVYAQQLGSGEAAQRLAQLPAG